MIESFRQKDLADLFEKGIGGTRKIDRRLQRRILVRLDTLHAAETLAELNVPGFDLHPLKAHKPRRYSIHVNGPWCITFEFHEPGRAVRVDLEQYH